MTTTDRVTGQHLAVLAEMAQLVAGGGGPDDVASEARLLLEYGVHVRLDDRDFDRCTAAEYRTAADYLDELVDAAEYLAEVITQACAMALDLQQARRDMTPVFSSPDTLTTNGAPR